MWLVVVVRDIRVRIQMAVVVGSHAAAAAANREGSNNQQHSPESQSVET